MKPIGYHVRLRLRDDRVIATTPRARRALAGIVLGQARKDRLLTFGVADTHLHLETGSDRVAAGQLARRIEIQTKLALTLPVGFSPPYFKPINDQHHLSNAFTYILKQESHHGLTSDPLHEASNLPDLLGLRLLGGYTIANVQSMLPRVRRETLLEILGAPNLADGQCPSEFLAEAAAAALGLPDLSGRRWPFRIARVAAVHAMKGKIPSKQIADQIGICVRTLRRMKHEPVDQRLVKAIRLQMALRQIKGEQVSRLSLNHGKGQAAGPAIR